MALAKNVFLMGSDGVIIAVNEAVALQSQTIRHLIEGGRHLIEGGLADKVIPLPNVSDEILVMVVRYCQMHVEGRATEQELRAWDGEFVRVDQAVLFELMMAAHNLKIQGLKDLTTQTVADMLKGKDPVEIAGILGKNITPEQEEALRREYSWAFQ